jgi:DNA polymerase-3 subunit alpha
MDCFGNHRSELLSVYESMMDSIASSRKKNLEGQMGLFGMLEEDTATAIPIPKMPEKSRSELMMMEKETTGMYISGHPMDDYRACLRNTHVVPVGQLMGDECPYQDEQTVSVAGIVQAIKMKTTRTGSMMAYVTVEDDTAAIEMLAFSNVLSQYGGFIRENEPVVVTGRLSLRDEKEPQIVINRVRPMSDFSNQTEQAPEETPPKPAQVLNGTLYLRLASETDPVLRKTKAILNMFPGESAVVLFFADTKVRRGTRCTLDSRMIEELNAVLGTENVVLK